jgi:hypothetical protein
MILKRNTFIGRFARAIRPFPGRPCTSLLLLAVVSLFGLARTSHAQAIPTAEKAGGLDAFAAVTITNPDYAPSKNAGFTVGGSYLLRKFFWGTPAFAARYSYTTGTTVNESFFGGGGELHYHYRMLRPYATVLYGVGGLAVPSIFNYSDSGNTLLIGGGADVPVSRKFAARGEFNYSFVDITGFHNTPVGEITLSPWSINIGVVYHIK